jgi:hypothetical protein
MLFFLAGLSSEDRGAEETVVGKMHQGAVSYSLNMISSFHNHQHIVLEVLGCNQKVFLARHVKSKKIAYIMRR